MNKSRLLLNSKRSEILSSEQDTEKISKLRTSANGRFTKPSKFLAKTTSSLFQIRKPLNIYMIEELKKLGRKTYFQRVYVLAQNIDKEKLKEYCQSLNSAFSDRQPADFREYFQRQVDEIFTNCEKNKSTADHLSGLFISMGDTHTYLMIEGAEDMIANFFEEFDLIHDRIWASSKVFLVEDRIDETYLNCFYSRRSPAINTNEKFPPSTPDDYKLMAVQHLKIKDKVKSVVESLSLQLKQTTNLTENLKVISDDPFYLPGDPFNKLLPEIQGIDLVLSANKFYHTVKDFSQTYRILQIHQDEDAFFWPIQNNYTPLDIFKRSEFDVNLTFGYHSKEENKQNEEHDFHVLEQEPQNI